MIFVRLFLHTLWVEQRVFRTRGDYRGEDFYTAIAGRLCNVSVQDFREI